MHFIECNAKKKYNYIISLQVHTVQWNKLAHWAGIKVPASVKITAYIIMQVR